MSSKTLIALGAAAISVVSYAFYFDYQRRHSPEFRRQVRAQNKKFNKQKEQIENESKQKQQAEILELIDVSLSENPIPADLKDREQFFIAELSRADELTTSEQFVEAALAFYRALVSYPKPMKMLAFYEQSIQPPQLLELVRAMVVARPPMEIASFMQDSLVE